MSQIKRILMLTEHVVLICFDVHIQRVVRTAKYDIVYSASEGCSRKNELQSYLTDIWGFCVRNIQKV